MTFSLSEALAMNGIQLTDRAREQFETYYRLLIEWNERMNLTAITEYDEVFEKHFYDSITPAFYFDFTKVDRLVDVGAGAGFPSLPLKIVYPHLHVTIIDSLNKRITFLRQLTEQLGLTDVQFVHGRAEELGHHKELRESFPLVLARAVARMPVLLELCLPFAKVGGAFIAYKGSSAEEEIRDAEKALKLLGGSIGKKQQLQLPSVQSNRMIIWVDKVKPTPKTYPRKPGTPNKSPIM